MYVRLCWISVKYIKRLCKEHCLYQILELNDVLCLHYKGEGIELVEALEEDYLQYATTVSTLVNHVHTLSCSDVCNEFSKV